MKIVNHVVILLALCCTLFSCVKEDLSLCPDFNVGLTFSYTLNVADEDKFADEVKVIGLYIFDSNGKYVGFQSENNITFSKEYQMPVSLAPGIYDFVVWANYDPKFYEVCSVKDHLPLEVGKSTFAEAMLLLKNTEGVVGAELPDLFHGIVTRAEIKESGVQRQKIMLIKNTNVCNVKLQNTESILRFITKAPAAELQMEITGDNGFMSFDNSLLPQMPQIIYKPYKTVGGAEFDFEVMRLRMERKMMLRVIHPTTGTVVLEKDLIQLILKSGEVKSNEDFDRIDNYDIVIAFGENVATDATITINGWVVEQPESDLN
ncbi:MAG: FimB/Mfa2 family fimbrial subunit [Rikenellaceae bacterium]